MPATIKTCLLFAGLVLLAPETAIAAEPLRAQVSVHGAEGEVQALQATLRSLFSAEAELEVSAVDAVDGAQVMRESSTPTSAGVLARAWVELHDGARVTIYVADASGERILVRHLPRGAQGDELVREATARVIATALEALLSGAQIGVEREQLNEAPRQPPPAPPPVSKPSPPAPAPARSASFVLGAHYGVQLFSSQIPLVHGPGLLFGAAEGGASTRLGTQVSAQLWWPAQTHDALAGVRIYSGAFRLLATVERSFGKVTLNAGVGGGVDLARVEPRAQSDAAGLEVAAPKTLATPALRAAFGSALQRAALSWYLSLAFDADPSRTRYVTTNDGVATPILQPRAVRPSLVVGVATP